MCKTYLPTYFCHVKKVDMWVHLWFAKLFNKLKCMLWKVIAYQLKLQSCFVTGWIRCRRLKFLSHWLSDRLSYESAIVLKLEVLDLGLLLLMCFFCVVCAFWAPSQAQSYFYIFQVLYKNSIFHFCCFGADWTGQ